MAQQLLCFHQWYSRAGLIPKEGHPLEYKKLTDLPQIKKKILQHNIHYFKQVGNTPLAGIGDDEEDDGNNNNKTIKLEDEDDDDKKEEAVSANGGANEKGEKEDNDNYKNNDNTDNNNRKIE